MLAIEQVTWGRQGGEIASNVYELFTKLEIPVLAC
jgi:hypothetical protein